MAAAAPAFTQLTDLASATVGGSAIFATDEFFAVASNLIEPADAVFDPNAFTEHGKLMDGWETRRKRIPGHDWAIVKLGLAGDIHGFEIDTAHFTGNFVPSASVQAASLDDGADAGYKLATLGKMGTAATTAEIEAADKLGSATWTTLVPKTALKSGVPATRQTYVAVDRGDGKQRYTHVRLNMFPDGGIARLRVYGNPVVGKLTAGESIDLLAVGNGGRALSCTNQHFGHPRNIILPGRGLNMGHGWETARHPGRPEVLILGDDGMIKDLKSDNSVLALAGTGGKVDSLVVDTNFFKGNFPESVVVHAATAPGATDAAIAELKEDEWKVLLPRAKTSASKEHGFELSKGELKDVGAITHVRVTIFPDGGIMRLRAFGVPTSV